MPKKQSTTKTTQPQLANFTVKNGKLKTTNSKKEDGLRKYARAVLTTGQPDYYNPLFQESSLMLPTKVRERNQYCRWWYNNDPMVSAAINFHSEFAITGFRNTCEDPVVKDFFDELAFDILDIPNLLTFMALEWYKLGNVMPMGTWNEDEGRWERFITLNPDYVEIEKTLFNPTSVLKLDPDESLKRIVQNRSPKALYDQLDPAIIPFVAKGQKIPLSNLIVSIENGDDVEFPQVSHLARKASMYEVYGQSLIISAFKILIYKDLLRKAQFAIAKRHWKPIKLIKIGDEKHEATDAVLESVEDAIRAADADENSWLIWHHYISVEYISSAGHVMPLNTEYDYIDRELMRSLEISDAVLTNQGMSFANASISLKVMLNKYQRFQKMLSRWVRKNVYEPVSKVQGFYKVDKDTGEKKLIVPEIEWELTGLHEDQQMKSLLQSMQDKGLVSKRTLLANMGLDWEREQDLMRQEQKEEKLTENNTEENKQNKGKEHAPNFTPTEENLTGAEPEMPSPEEV